MTSSKPAHEKLFDEICGKLNELSHRTTTEAESLTMDDASNSGSPSVPPQQNYEKMQTQMKKFHLEMRDSQEKIKTLGNVTYGSEGIDMQIRQLAEQLNNERLSNTKLSGDLAKSLELCLQLQLEIQGLKARALQMQAEDKKYAQTLSEKNKHLQKELELSEALKDEMSLELAKAKNSFQKDQEIWVQQKDIMENKFQVVQTDRDGLHLQIDQLNTDLNVQHEQIQDLNTEIEKISTSFSEVERTAHQQTEVLKNLMEVAESKIIEMKLALDKKTLETQDAQGQLRQALTQLGVFKQENGALKDYIEKLTYYHQQVQAIQQHQIANPAPQPN
jgi:chromosome segregation ATPase